MMMAQSQTFDDISKANNYILEALKITKDKHYFALTENLKIQQ